MLLLQQKRLIKRGRDNRKEIKLRLSLAMKEIKHYKEYKYILINENVQQTVNNIIKIIDHNLLIYKNQKLLNKKLIYLIKN